MKTSMNHEINRDQWNTFLENNRYATPFQTPIFFDLFNSIPGCYAMAFAVEEDEQICALAVVAMQREQGLKSIFSKRGIIYGGPLYSSERKNALEILLTSIDQELGSKLIYLETRNCFDYSSVKDVFLLHKWNYIPHLNYHLDIVNEGQINAALSASRRRQIKKAINSGATWKVADKLEDVRQFYLILNDLYRRKIKKPLLSWKFFEQFYQSRAGRFLLVYQDCTVIGGIMCPILPGHAIYEFYICGLDDKYKEQFPSVLATWAAIQYGLQNNIPKFDFMGAGKPNEDYGVREFKARFGGELIEHGRFLKITRPILFKIGKAGLNFKSKYKL